MKCKYSGRAQLDLAFSRRAILDFHVSTKFAIVICCSTKGSFGTFPVLGRAFLLTHRRSAKF